MQTLQLGARALLLASLAHTAAGQTCPTLIDVAPGIEPAHGNPTSTHLEGIKDAWPTSYDAPMTLIGGLAYLTATDSANKTELYTSDGTAAGTQMSVVTSTDLFGSAPRNVAEFAGDIYCSATVGGFFVGQRELVRITGPAQFEQLTNFNDNECSLHALTPLGGRLLFAASTLDKGFEAYAYTPGIGTSILADLPAASGLGLATENATDIFYRDAAGTTAYYYQQQLAGSIALMRTDGTPAGTSVVVDFGTPTSEFFPLHGNTDGMRWWQGQLYFTGWSAAAGEELWRTDGTVAGTQPVGDFAPGVADAVVRLEFATEFAGELYFVMDDGVSGSELWKTDGATTQLAFDLVPGAAGSQPNELRVLGGELFFTADLPATGRELYKLTAGGALQLVADVQLGPESGFAPKNSRLTFTNTGLYFVADDGATGRELWVYNGTAQLVADLMPGSTPSEPLALTPLADGSLLFAAEGAGVGRELWRTDGTAAGTTLVKNFKLESGGDSSNPVLGDELVGGRMFLRAETHAEGVELRSLDVATGQLELTTNAETATGVDGLDDLEDFETATVMVAGKATTFFSATHSTTGYELWATDGTLAGSYMVKDVRPGVVSSWPESLVAAGGRVYFSAISDSLLGRELWTSDGTAAGTQFVKDIRPSGSSNPEWIVALGDRVLFRADDFTHGPELWVSDGTAAGTQLVLDIFPGGAGGFEGRPVRVGDRIYFVGSDPVGGPTRLWVSDGTTAGTRRITNFGVQEIFPDAAEWKAGYGKLYFTGYHPSSGAGVFSMDLVTEQVRLVADLGPGWATNTPTFFEVAERGLFVATRENGGPSAGSLYLFPADPPPSTVPVDLLAGFTLDSIANLHAVGRGVYFTAAQGATGNELYYSDGTPSGTMLVCDLWPGPNGSSPTDLRSADGVLYFAADNGVNGRELFRVEVGQATATVLAVDDALADLRITPPVLGATAQVDLTGAPPAALNLLVMSAPTSQPSALFGTSWSDPLSASLLALIGSAQALPVPANPALAGARLHLQVYSAEPALGTITTSNGVRVQLGN